MQLKDQTHITQRKLKILFVDDNPLDLQIILNQLSDKYEVTFATNGVEAMFHAAQNPQPDILLIDIHMPNMNGFELCKKLSENSATSNIPIIFITANTSIKTKTRAFDVGCVDYVNKPIDINELILRINNHVKLSRQAHTIDILSTLHPLTNICNYHKYVEELTTEWATCKRYDYPLSLLHCQIDDFEQTVSAIASEYVTKTIQIIANALRDIGNRPGDSVAHIDTDTFAIVLSDSKISHAVNCAKEIVTKVSALNIILRPGRAPLKVTVSVGVSSVFPEENISTGDLHVQAGNALIEAREMGGNTWKLCDLSHIVSS